MKQSAKQNEEKRVVGLASENRLPDAFKAKTNEDAGTVELRKPNHRSVDIGIASYQAVANLLATFARDGEPSLDPGATITITDNFSNKTMTITANTFVDVAAVFHAFVVRRGRYKPPTEITRSEEVPAARKKARAQSKSVAASPPVQEKAVEQPSEEHLSKSAEGNVKPSENAATAHDEKPATPATQSPKTTRKASEPEVQTKSTDDASKKSAPVPTAASDSPAATAFSTFPDWAKKVLQVEYEDAVWGFKFTAASLSMTENGKAVLGRDEGDAEHKAAGYEVVVHDRHVGWIVAEGETSFYLTGIENYDSTRHRNIDPAIKIRIRRVIYPLLGLPTPDGA